MGALNIDNALSVYSGKRVFITGHTGFKGAWLAFLLNEIGAKVRGFSLDSVSVPSHFELLSLKDGIDHIVGDIRDRVALDAAMQEFQPEFVFHLAAQALVKESYSNPVSTFETNVMGSVNALEAVRRCNSVRSFVYITSDKCYENVEWLWGYRENDRLGGHDPYSASKGAAEIVFSAYARSYFASRSDLGAATTRAGNVIGGGDWAADRIIPDCIRAIENNVAIKLRNPNATRPWQHVLEPINGYLILGAHLYEDPQTLSGSWNFGPSSEEIRTVEQVAKEIVLYIGKGFVEVEAGESIHHEANLLQLNCDKARQLLNWTPRWGVDKTLEVTAAWYKAYMENADIEALTRAQLHDFYPELS